MKLGIPGKLIVTLGLCGVLVLSMTGLMEYHSGQLLIERQIENKLTDIGQRLSLTLRRSVYEFDKETVRDTILAEFPERGLESVVVWTRDRKRLLAGLTRGKDGRPADTEILPQGKGLIERTQVLTLADEDTPAGRIVVGEFALVFDQRFMQQQLLKEILYRQIKIILMVLLLLLVLGEIVRRALVWPLEQLRQAMSRAETDVFASKGDLSGFAIGENCQGFLEMRQMGETFRHLIDAIVYRQKALQVSEERYRQLSQEFEAVLEGIVDSLVLFNPNLEAVWANRAATEQFGLTQEQLKGRTCHQLWRGEAGDFCTEAIQAVFSYGKPSEGMCPTADGRTWGVKGYPLRNHVGEVINVIQISSDLTEKLTLREEATRSTHLAALGSLSAGVAHEINNPTGLILMSVPIVQAVFDDILKYLDEHEGDLAALSFGGLPYVMVREEIPRNLFDIWGGAQRIKSIVEDLKNFARQEVKEAQQEVDLGDVVSSALRLLGNLVKNSTHFLVLDIADDVPKIRGSRQRLEQVVVNLLQNACHALRSPDQAIAIKVVADHTRHLVVLQVSDEGVGIPADIRGKITDPFFTTRRESGGTGLGLSVSARIISDHQGTLSIDSMEGHGSTFTVELPIPEEGADVC